MSEFSLEECISVVGGKETGRSLARKPLEGDAPGSWLTVGGYWEGARVPGEEGMLV